MSPGGERSLRVRLDSAPQKASLPGGADVEGGVLGEPMQSPIGTFIVAAAAAIALTATPAAAQHRGGGHSGGGHSSGGHGSGGGHVSSGATHRGTHASGGGHTTSRQAVGRAVPRASAVRPRIDRHTTIVVPSHRGHFGGIGAFGLGLSVGTYGYPYGYGYSRYGYGYRGYYGYSSGYYGGYVRNGHARLRILGAPRDAEVYVDGYYAGIVDDFDGRLQHLELEPGPHQIELRAAGFAPIMFDMNAIVGRTITYRAQMVPYRP